MKKVYGILLGVLVVVTLIPFTGSTPFALLLMVTLGLLLYKDELQTLVTQYVQPSHSSADEVQAPSEFEVLQERSKELCSVDEAQEERVSPFSLQWQQGQWNQFEERIGEVIVTYLTHLHHCTTVDTLVLFLPSSESTFTLAKMVSTKEVVAWSQITIGEGFVGGLLKEGIAPRRFVAQASLHQLPYYQDMPTTLELFLVPVEVMGKAGFLLGDRIKREGFSDSEMLSFTETAELLSSTLTYGYQATQHTLYHKELAEISLIENTLLESTSIEALLDQLVAEVERSFDITALSLSLRSSENQAKIVRQRGKPVYLFEDFSLTEEGIVPLVYQSRESFSRDFSVGSKEFRYKHDEKVSVDSASFIALPLVLDEVAGVLLLESSESSGFSLAATTTLERIVRAATTSLGRLQIMDHTNNLAIRDGLTGLYNHRQFQTLLHEALVRSRRLSMAKDGSGEQVEETSPVALALCDIDFFKKCNDIHGHQFGDLVLEEVARMLEAGIRTGIDTAARYGGEEFALILTGSSPHEVYQVVNRLRETVAAFPFVSPQGEALQVTLSFGIAFYDQDAHSQAELIRKADKAMYRAKELGRNRVELYRM